MKSNKIDVHSGHGRLKSATEVEVTGADNRKTSLKAKNVILAMGSVPRHVPFIKVDGKNFVTSDEVLELENPPKSLIVLGAGAVGIEFASVYSRFGTECTVVEMLDRALPIEDAEVSAELEKALKKRGISVHTGTKLEKAETKGGIVVATLANKKESWTIEAEKLLVAIGRAPVTGDAGLKTVGITPDKAGFIEVDSLMQTSKKGVYAIGDIVKTPQLAHIASAEALVAADHISGKNPRPLNYNLTPSCTYCDPEVASVGLTEQAAKDAGYIVKVGKFPFSASGKARIMGKPEGFVKIIADAKYDEILGVHIIGARATDLIAEACVAMQLECTAEELAHTIHAHPTLPEAVLEAAHGATGRPLHM
jgi:dihydrolipoamide dehydrogenase